MIEQTPAGIVRFKTQQSLALRLVIATLTGRIVHISQIRANSPSHTGLAPHEVSFLRLLEAVTNGSHIEISYSGTTVLYKPGLIAGGSRGTGATSTGVIRHEISADVIRGVSYFLIPLCLLAPFSKERLTVHFTGPGVITSSVTQTGDISVDSVRAAILPLYRHFGIYNNIELRIKQRSNPGPRGKGGAGEVELVFGHQVRLPKTIHLLNPGKVKRIRGVAYCTGVSASNNARMIEVARGILNPMTPDTYIFSDVSSAPRQPGFDSDTRKIGIGFGLSLVAESSTGCLFSADVASPPSGGATPEDIGTQCAYQLLEAISHGGSVSLAAAPTMLVLMALGSEDVGRLQLGKEVIAHPNIVRLARDLKAFGASGWGVRHASEENLDEFVVSIVGRGVSNIGRKIA